MPGRRGRWFACVGVMSAFVLVLLPACAFGLPEGRHYEMVSPFYKAGYGVTYFEGAAPDGDSAAFSSLGAFAGAPGDRVGAGQGSAYLARRGAFGWFTVPDMAPAWITPYSAPPVEDFSADLGVSVLYGQLGSNTEAAAFGSESEFLLHSSESDPTSGFEVAGEALKARGAYGGGSADLSRLVIEPASEAAGLTPETKSLKMFSSVYELASHGEAGSAIKFIALNNQLKPKPLDPNCREVTLGGDVVGVLGKDSMFNALSVDGREIFFTTCAGSEESHQLFVRLDGVRTLEVSRPFEGGAKFGGCVGEANGVRGEVPCKGAATRPYAEFVGASEDGSKVFFVTKASLSEEDTDTSTDLYMASIGCLAAEPDCEVSKREVTGLVQVSRDSSGPADVQGVVAVSPSGSRVYFVARGVLSGANAEGASPVSGADNLYLYDSVTGSTVFVADLCSGSGVSGEYPDPECPPRVYGTGSLREGGGLFADESLWRSILPEAQTASDGRFLLFSSFGRLANDDTDNALDVYRYDAQEGRLLRVSVGQDGNDANGNSQDEGDGEYAGEESADAGIALSKLSEMSHASVQAELAERAISEDGSRIVFHTAEPLSSLATNGLVDAYEWHEGNVSLVSSGSDEQSVGAGFRSITITPSGTDIFFTTVQRLLGEDTDNAPDVYDARLGTGFAPVPAPVQSCYGDACQGPLTNPAPLLVPGSVSQAAGENVEAAPAVKPRARKHGKAFGGKHKRKRKRKGLRAKRSRRVGRAAGIRRGDRRGR